MKSLIISYDLCGSEKNYTNLIERIKSYEIWAHITESTWFIKTDSSCIAVHNHLYGAMDRNDRLFVAELARNAAWENAICSDQYLKNNL